MLWTWQTPEVADTLAHGHAHRALWRRIDRAGQGAYREMANEMAAAGIYGGPNPPVWFWCDEPDPDTVADRCYHVAREGEPERGLVVLTVEAPDALVLLSSYAGWIERLADPSEPRPWPHRPAGLHAVPRPRLGAQLAAAAVGLPRTGRSMTGASSDSARTCTSRPVFDIGNQFQPSVRALDG